ncbi:MAG TPA: HAD-IC family P-type ATPase [Planktothrix sp.]
MPTTETTPENYQVVHAIPGRLRVRIDGLYRRPSLALGVLKLLHGCTGLRSARANADCASLIIEYDPEWFDPIAWLDRMQLEKVAPIELKRHEVAKPILAPLHRATYDLEERLPPRTQFVLGALAFGSSLLGVPAPIARALTTLSAIPILNRALQTVLEERRVGVDMLDGTSCLFLVANERFLPASLMTCLIGLGEFIRDNVTQRCQRLIAHQLALFKQSVWLMKGHGRVRVPLSELNAGDRVVTYAGELIPFEAMVLEGEGKIVPADPETDFEPIDVKPGDVVASNMVLLDGKLYLRYDRHESTALARDLGKLKKRQRWLQRTKLQRDALKTGYKRIGPMLWMSGLFFFFTRRLEGALSIITFDFITGIKIAIPIAVLASMDHAGRRGVIVRSATALEKLSEVDVVVFARSGTLTALQPVVSDVFICNDFSVEEVTTLAAAVAERYNYLQAYAIFRYAHVKTMSVPQRTSSQRIPGLGVSGQVNGRTVVVGRTRLMEENGIDLSPAAAFLETCRERGDSRACVAIDGKLAGIIAYQDPLRPHADSVVKELHALGIKEIAMMTGGSQESADSLAKKVGIDKVYYRTLPVDQAEIVRAYKKLGRKVAVVGDDTDDALALEVADVGITLESSADVARYRADVILTEGLPGLVDAIEVAREGMQLARQNMFVVSAPNWLGLGLTVTGRVESVVATLLNNGSVIVGAANGMRPLLVKDEADVESEDRTLLD